MTTIDYQQAAIQAGAKALAEHQIGEDWGDDGVTFVGCDCGQWFGKRVNDGEELARTHEAQAALTAATPHLRAAWAEEVRAIDIPEHRLHDQLPSDHWYAGQKAMRDEIVTLLEGGAE